MRLYAEDEHAWLILIRYEMTENATVNQQWFAYLQILTARMGVTGYVIMSPVLFRS